MTRVLPFSSPSVRPHFRDASATPRDLVQLRHDPTAAALGGPAWQATAARHIGSLVIAPACDAAEALDGLSRSLAAVMVNTPTQPALQLILAASPALRRLDLSLRAEVMGADPTEARTVLDTVMCELDQVLGGCDVVRAQAVHPGDVSLQARCGRVAAISPQRIAVEGLAMVALPPGRQPGGAVGMGTVAGLLLVQSEPCAVVLSMRHQGALPALALPLRRASAAYAQLRALADGVEVHADQARLGIRRFPEDLAWVEGALPAVQEGCAQLLQLSQDAVVFRLAVVGQTPLPGTLLRAVQAALLGMRTVAWGELTEDQVSEHTAGPFAALHCPTHLDPVPATVSALAWHLPTSGAAALLSLPAPGDDQGWAGLPVDRCPPRPLPLCLHGGAGARIGVAELGAALEDVRLGPADVARHVYVSGKTGVGKSTLLRTLALDLAATGGGIGVVDPHGDLVDDIAAALSGVREVVIFDPTAPDGPGLDPMAHDGSKLGMERVCEELTAMMFRLYARDTMGPMFERYSQALILPVLALRGSLADLSRLAHDRAFRTRALAALDKEDPLHAEVVRFWSSEHSSWSTGHTGEMNSYVLSKYDSLVRSTALRRACQPGRPQLDIAGIADRGGVVLARLPEGRLGPVSAWFLGMLFVSRLQQAVFGRSCQAAGTRRPFTLFLDEFQHFLGGGGFSFTDEDRTLAPLLSEARKFGLRLVLANQYVAQLDRGTREAIFGNVGSLVAFRVGSNDAELLARELGISAAELREQPLFRAVARVLVDGQLSPVFTLQTVAPEPLGAMTEPVAP